MERKKFLKNFAVGGSILFTSPVLFSACSKDDDIPDDGDGGNDIMIDLNDLSLNSVGDFDYSGDIIVIRTGENSYTALSKICTHQQCTVSYNHSSGQLPCPCHGSVFSTTGSVINGPAESSLQTYSVAVNGDTLILS